ncbi:hypothetical protein G6L28_18770 [Agrobacterium larrymoorei]|uniref:hypothetical protein n=1 Tax=Agrobacterium larrymoorei TaxID=160699 RepID=UPI0015749837|nr:hypothetical protein [Agrobacterium larrymoorei]NTJ44642.1 hypothetical protein [Agrobacterium larrymoorei]
MSITPETEATHREEEARKVHPKPKKRHAAALAVGALTLLVIGVAGGAGAMKLTRPSIELAPLAPTAISAMSEDSLISVKGKVAEIFGNKFVIQDDSGRALVETGPEGEGGTIVKQDEVVTVQGRFDNGFLHGSYIVHEDGKTDQLGPAGKPPRGPEHGPLTHLLK